MKVVVFGSRGITSYALIERAMIEAANQGIVPTLILSGTAPGGDALGELWAKRHNVPVKPYPAQWSDLTVRGASVRSRADGTRYNARAGHDRNVLMGTDADAGVGVWDGKSSGTRDMLTILRNLNKLVHVELVGPQQPTLFDTV